MRPGPRTSVAYREANIGIVRRAVGEGGGDDTSVPIDAQVQLAPATKPSVCRSGTWKTVRKVNAVTIAKSEYLRCPPGRPLGDAFHANIDSSPNQTVMSPRPLRAISYAAQFFTRYFVLYCGITLVFVRATISDPPRVSIQGTGSPGPMAMSNEKSHAPTP
jgi:hypothetical protein